MSLVSILDLGFLTLPHSSLIFLHKYPVRCIAVDPIITVMLMSVLLDVWGVVRIFVRNSLYCAARLVLRLSETLCSETLDTELSSLHESRDALKSYNLRLCLGPS